VPATEGTPVAHGVENGRDPGGFALESRPLMPPFRRTFALRAGQILVGAALGLRAALASAGDDPSVTVRELDPKTGAAIKEEPKALTYLSLGPLFSFVDANSVQSTVLGQPSTGGYAIGLEGSLNHYAGERVVFAFGYGLFLQTQLENAKYFRADFGVQGNAGPVGLELGFGIRQGDGTYGTTGSFHGALFLSAGYLVISYRVSPELFSFPSNEPSFGLETAISIGIKLPIALQGRDPTGYAIQANGHAW
jgi:hypothetical protein